MQPGWREGIWLEIIVAGAQNIPANPVVNSIAAQTKSSQIFDKYLQCVKDFYGLQQSQTHLLGKSQRC